MVDDCILAVFLAMYVSYSNRIRPYFHWITVVNHGPGSWPVFNDFTAVYTTYASTWNPFRFYDFLGYSHNCCIKGDFLRRRKDVVRRNQNVFGRILWDLHEVRLFMVGIDFVSHLFENYLNFDLRYSTYSWNYIKHNSSIPSIRVFVSQIRIRPNTAYMSR